MSNKKIISKINEIHSMQLQEGQTIKNYKEMCSLLDLKVATGNAKISQMKEIERFYKLQKKGHGFIVEEVYHKPLPKEDGRVNNGGNNTKYEDLMDRIIINILKDYGYIEESFSQIMSMLNLFTNKYESLSKSGYKTFAEINNLGVGITLTYQQKLNNIIKKAMETSLNRLSKQGVIEYRKAINVRDMNFENFIADEKMEEKIKKVEQETYTEQNIKYYNRILLDVNRKFKNSVAKELDIISYWNIYCIELVDKNTDYVEEDKDELIRRLIESVIKSVKGKTNTDEFGNKFQPYSFPKYQEQIDKLTRLLIKLPDNYVTEVELNKEILYLFGNNSDKTATEEEFDCSSDAYYFYEYNNAIPF